MLYFPTEPLFSLWFLQIATFSMLPLLVLDQLVLPFVSLIIIYLTLIHIVVKKTHALNILSPTWDILSLNHIHDNKLIICLFYLSTLVGCTTLLIGQMFIKPPESLPFLFPLLVSAYSCVHFVLFFIYFNYRQISAAISDTSNKLDFSKAKKLNKKKKL